MSPDLESIGRVGSGRSRAAREGTAATNRRMENGGESWAMRVGSGSVVWDLPLENNGYHYLDYGGRVISSQESAPPVSLAVNYLLGEEWGKSCRYYAR